MAGSTDLVLYHAAPSRSSIALWMLEEVGQPFRVELLSLQQGDQRKPDFLKLNAMGKVPTLTYGPTVVTEAAAICAFLADVFPQAGLAPPPGDPRRGPYYRWLFFGPSCLEPSMIDKMAERPPVSSSMAGWGSLDAVLDTLAQALVPGPYLLGETFSAADVVLGSGLHWGTLFKGIPERPVFRAYLDRLDARPALQRARKRDAETMPKPS